MTSQKPQPSHLTRIPISWWIGTLLVLGVFAIYWPVLGYDFVDYDDSKYVYENPQVLAGLSWRSLAWAFTSL